MGSESLRFSRSSSTTQKMKKSLMETSVLCREDCFLFVIAIWQSNFLFCSLSNIRALQLLLYVGHFFWFVASMTWCMKFFLVLYHCYCLGSCTDRLKNVLRKQLFDTSWCPIRLIWHGTTIPAKITCKKILL